MTTRLTVKLDMDNAAFTGSGGHEAARILRKLADTLADSFSVEVGEEHILMDVNGNRVGLAKVHASRARK